MSNVSNNEASAIVSNNEANEYHAAIIKRVADVKNDANKQLVMKLATAVAMQKNTTFLQANNILASDFIDARHAADKLCIYSVKQIVNVLNAVTKARESASLHDVSETVYAALKTALNFSAANKTFTKADLCACIDAKAVVSDDKKTLIYRKKSAHDAAYAARQMTIALNVMRVLKMIKAENKLEFSVIKSSAVAKALVKLTSEAK